MREAASSNRTRADKQGNRRERQSPSRPIEGFHRSYLLFAENKNALLPGEAHFLHLPVFTQQHGVVI